MYMTQNHKNIVMASVLALTAATGASAATLNVPGQFGSVQSAINAAQTADTVLIQDGFYDEDVTINGKTLIFIVADGDFVFLQSAFVQNSNGITFDGLRFNGHPTRGVEALNAVSVTVANCRFTDIAFGLSATNCQDITIQNSKFTRSDIQLIDTEDVLMQRTKVKSSEVNFQNCPDAVVTESKFIKSLCFALASQGMTWDGNLFKKSRLAVANSTGMDIEGNTFKRFHAEDQAGYPLFTRINDSSIEDNRFVKTGPLGGIRVEGNDNFVLNNIGKKSQGNGMSVSGTGNRIEGNRVKRSADFDLFDAAGPGQNEYVNNNFQTSNL